MSVVKKSSRLMVGLGGALLMVLLLTLSTTTGSAAVEDVPPSPSRDAQENVAPPLDTAWSRGSGVSLGDLGAGRPVPTPGAEADADAMVGGSLGTVSAQEDFCKSSDSGHELVGGVYYTGPHGMYVPFGKASVDEVVLIWASETEADTNSTIFLNTDYQNVAELKQAGWYHQLPEDFVLLCDNFDVAGRVNSTTLGSPGMAVNEPVTFVADTSQANSCMAPIELNNELYLDWGAPFSSGLPNWFDTPSQYVDPSWGATVRQCKGWLAWMDKSEVEPMWGMVLGGSTAAGSSGQVAPEAIGLPSDCVDEDTAFALQDAIYDYDLRLAGNAPDSTMTFFYNQLVTLMEEAHDQIRSHQRDEYGEGFFDWTKASENVHQVDAERMLEVENLLPEMFKPWAIVTAEQHVNRNLGKHKYRESEPFDRWEDGINYLANYHTKQLVEACAELIFVREIDFVWQGLPLRLVAADVVRNGERKELRGSQVPFHESALFIAGEVATVQLQFENPNRVDLELPSDGVQIEGLARLNCPQTRFSGLERKTIRCTIKVPDSEVLEIHNILPMTWQVTHGDATIERSADVAFVYESNTIFRMETLEWRPVQDWSFLGDTGWAEISPGGSITTYAGQDVEYRSKVAIDGTFSVVVSVALTAIDLANGNTPLGDCSFGVLFSEETCVFTSTSPGVGSHSLELVGARLDVPFATLNFVHHVVDDAPADALEIVSVEVAPAKYPKVTFGANTPMADRHVVFNERRSSVYTVTVTNSGPEAPLGVVDVAVVIPEPVNPLVGRCWVGFTEPAQTKTCSFSGTGYNPLTDSTGYVLATYAGALDLDFGTMPDGVELPSSVARLPFTVHMPSPDAELVSVEYRAGLKGEPVIVGRGDRLLVPNDAPDGGHWLLLQVANNEPSVRFPLVGIKDAGHRCRDLFWTGRPTESCGFRIGNPNQGPIELYLWPRPTGPYPIGWFKGVQGEEMTRERAFLVDAEGNEVELGGNPTPAGIYSLATEYRPNYIMKGISGATCTVAGELVDSETWVNPTDIVRCQSPSRNYAAGTSVATQNLVLTLGAETASFSTRAIIRVEAALDPPALSIEPAQVFATRSSTEYVVNADGVVFVPAERVYYALVNVAMPANQAEPLQLSVSVNNVTLPCGDRRNNVNSPVLEPGETVRCGFYTLASNQTSVEAIVTGTRASDGAKVTVATTFTFVVGEDPAAPVVAATIDYPADGATINVGENPLGYTGRRTQSTPDPTQGTGTGSFFVGGTFAGGDGSLSFAVDDATFVDEVVDQSAGTWSAEVLPNEGVTEVSVSVSHTAPDGGPVASDAIVVSVIPAETGHTIYNSAVLPLSSSGIAVENPPAQLFNEANPSAGVQLTLAAGRAGLGDVTVGRILVAPHGWSGLNYGLAHRVIAVAGNQVTVVPATFEQMFRQLDFDAGLPTVSNVQPHQNFVAAPDGATIGVTEDSTICVAGEDPQTCQQVESCEVELCVPADPAGAPVYVEGSPVQTEPSGSIVPRDVAPAAALNVLDGSSSIGIELKGEHAGVGAELNTTWNLDHEFELKISNLWDPTLERFATGFRGDGQIEAKAWAQFAANFESKPRKPLFEIERPFMIYLIPVTVEGSFRPFYNASIDGRVEAVAAITMTSETRMEWADGVWIEEPKDGTLDIDGTFQSFATIDGSLTVGGVFGLNAMLADAIGVGVDIIPSLTFETGAQASAGVTADIYTEAVANAATWEFANSAYFDVTRNVTVEPKLKVQIPLFDTPLGDIGAPVANEELGLFSGGSLATTAEMAAKLVADPKVQLTTAEAGVVAAKCVLLVYRAAQNPQYSGIDSVFAPNQKHWCNTVPVYLPGYRVDEPQLLHQASLFRSVAISAFPAWTVQARAWDSSSGGGHSRAWLTNRDLAFQGPTAANGDLSPWFTALGVANRPAPNHSWTGGCTAVRAEGTNCDEFPNSATVNGGDRDGAAGNIRPLTVMLEASSNQSEGGSLGQLFTQCGLTKQNAVPVSDVANLPYPMTHDGVQWDENMFLVVPTPELVYDVNGNVRVPDPSVYKSTRLCN